jgi:hypothetical protein
MIYIYIYFTAVGLTPGGSSTSRIYTQTVHIIQRKENWKVRENLEEHFRQNKNYIFARTCTYIIYVFPGMFL